MRRPTAAGCSFFLTRRYFKTASHVHKDPVAIEQSGPNLHQCPMLTWIVCLSTSCPPQLGPVPHEKGARSGPRLVPDGLYSDGNIPQSGTADHVTSDVTNCS